MYGVKVLIDITFRHLFVSYRLVVMMALMVGLFALTSNERYEDTQEPPAGATDETSDEKRSA